MHPGPGGVPAAATTRSPLGTPATGGSRSTLSLLGNDPAMSALFSSYGWGNGGTERLSDWSVITSRVSGRSRVPRAWLHPLASRSVIHSFACEPHTYSKGRGLNTRVAELPGLLLEVGREQGEGDEKAQDQPRSMLGNSHSQRCHINCTDPVLYGV